MKAASAGLSHQRDCKKRAGKNRWNKRYRLRNPANFIPQHAAPLIADLPEARPAWIVPEHEI
jgi:hypothetical protein